jgi:hypothetical protein
MDDLARERDALYRIAVVQGPVVVFAHPLQDVGLAGFETVFNLSVSATPESDEKALIDGSG